MCLNGKYDEALEPQGALCFTPKLVSLLMPHNAGLRRFACQLVARILREYLRAILHRLLRTLGNDGSGCFCPRFDA